VIKARREQLNYSQNYMAEKISISQNAYSKFELGYSQATLFRLFQVCDILELRIAALFPPPEHDSADR